MGSAKSGWMNGRTDTRTRGWTDRRTDGQTDAGYFIVPLSGFFEPAGGKKPILIPQVLLHSKQDKFKYCNNYDGRKAPSLDSQTT